MCQAMEELYRKAEFDKVKERVRRRVAQLARWRKKVVAQQVI